MEGFHVIQFPSEAHKKEKSGCMRVEVAGQKAKETQDLKEMELAGSGLCSAIIQMYWLMVLQSYYHTNDDVRIAAMQVNTCSCSWTGKGSTSFKKGTTSEKSEGEDEEGYCRDKLSHKKLVNPFLALPLYSLSLTHTISPSISRKLSISIYHKL